MYRLWRIPTDAFDRLPLMRTRFVAAWNRQSQRDDSSSDVMHYMITLRKRGMWERFDGDYDRISLKEYGFTADDMAVAEGIYAEQMVAVGIGSDNIAFDDSLADTLSHEFAKQTGRIVPGLALLALIMQKRKRGRLVKVGSQARRKPDIGFGDIDEIAE